MVRILIPAIFLVAFATGLHAQTAGAAPATTKPPIDTTRTPELDLDAARKKLPLYVQAVSTTLDSAMRAAVSRVPSPERRLLVVRGYVRRVHRKAAEWSWSRAQVAEYRKTREYRELTDHVAEAQRCFAQLNPGYRIDAAIEVRTLDEQIHNWNTVVSIGVSGREIVDTALIVLADTTLPAVPDSLAIARFRAFLDGYELVNTPTVAVPGFSEHGQLRAFDFKVYRGRKLIAGTTTATIAEKWEAAGWACKLAEAICQISDRFVGPLFEPYEPWHYAYRPELSSQTVN